MLAFILKDLPDLRTAEEVLFTSTFKQKFQEGAALFNEKPGGAIVEKWFVEKANRIGVEHNHVVGRHRADFHLVERIENGPRRAESLIAAESFHKALDDFVPSTLAIELLRHKTALVCPVAPEQFLHATKTRLR